MKIGNQITVTGVEEVMWNLPKNRFTYSDWLQLTSERIAECFSGVEIESNVIHIVISFAEELALLAQQYDVTLQSVVDNFTEELLLGKEPETSFFIVEEKLKSPYIYQLAKFSEREEKPWPLENTLKI